MAVFDAGQEIYAIKFCSECGQPVTRKIPPGDDHERDVCEHCGTIHYQNPLMVVGCVPEHHDGRILLCRRAIEPRKGYWTIPAGFLENDETLEAGAERETWEEALARVELGSLLAMVNVTQARQVHIMFRARLIGDEHGPGDESLETALIDEADIPWDEIAFPSIEFALRHFLSDRALQREDVHLTEVPHLRVKH